MPAESYMTPKEAVEMIRAVARENRAELTILLNRSRG